LIGESTVLRPHRSNDDEVYDEARVMSGDLEQERGHLHAIIDHLTARQLVAVRGLLDAMLDPFDRKLASAEIDDEPLTAEERTEIETSRHTPTPGVPFEKVIADLGFSMDDVVNYRDPDENSSRT
jgi:hypothetical protein